MAGSDPAPTLNVVSPFDGRPLATIPAATAMEVQQACRSARTAQRDWAETSVAERSRIIKRFADLVLQDCDRILDTIQDESGKSRLSAFEEVMDTARGARVFANLAPAVLHPTRRPGVIPILTKVIEYHHPAGLVAIITPWNYPFTLPATDAVAALLAGNAVVLKPDSQTPLSALLLAELLTEAGLPEGLFTVLPGAGATVGPALIDAADYLMFTGSTATGRLLARSCADQLMGFSAELGGKNPLLVLPDADLDAAARGTARAAFANTGQLCISIERAYVHADVYAEFLPRLIEATQALRLGSGHDWAYDIGSLISAEHLATVAEHVTDAVAHGATVLTGGRARPDLGPFFYEPTILTDVGDPMLVHREETFGPVLSVYPVASMTEAISAANDSRYGLNASVWSARHGAEVATRLRTGTVNINDGYAPAFGSHHAPMGGMGDSGLGRRHGAVGLLKYTESQTVADQRLLPLAPPPGVTNQTYATAMRVGIRLLNKFVR